MKICMFVRNPVTADPRVQREAAALVAAGHEVVVIGIQKAGEPADEVQAGIRIRRLPGLGQRLAPLRRVLRRGSGSTGGAGGGGGSAARPRVADQTRLQRQGAELHYQLSAVAAGLAEGADAYHAHDLDTLRPAQLCARLRRAKLVYDSHELWIDWQANKVGAPDWLLAQWRRTERAGYAAADRVITIGEALADELVSLYGPPTPMVLRNCAPLRPRAEGDALRQLIGGDPGRALVLYQGGFSDGRGLMELVAAADQVPGADFVALGPASPYRDALAAQAAKARHGNVHVREGVSFEALWPLTCSADIGVVLTQPVCRSYELSLSNKVFEYLVAGIAILASDIASHRALAAETGALALADGADPAALAAALNPLVADRGRLAALGLAARRAAEERYHAEREFARLVELYARL